MIALTQEKREELIEDCHDSIGRIERLMNDFPHDVYNLENALIKNKVVLASLTADKLSKDASESLIAMVEYALSHRMCMGMDEGFKSFDPDVEHDFVQEIRNFIASGDSFFTAPPVPYIKLPSIESLAEEYKYQVSPHDTVLLRFALNVIKRLNGLEE